MLIASVVTGRTDTRYGFATLVTISLAAAVLTIGWIRHSASHQRAAVDDPAGDRAEMTELI
jgi:hypothetical protein